jgi:hypothetical protein
VFIHISLFYYRHVQLVFLQTFGRSLFVVIIAPPEFRTVERYPSQPFISDEEDIHTINVRKESLNLGNLAILEPTDYSHLFVEDTIALLCLIVQ